MKRRESVRSEYPQSGNWSLKCEETREASSAPPTTEEAA